MENVTIEISAEKIEAAINNAVEEVMKSSYGNPLVDVVREELKAKQGVFREMFQKLLVELMGSDEFKKKMGEIAMASLFEKALKN